MATIKSYTDIEQSRKLAEILSLKSADQSYIRVAIAGDNLNIPEEMQYKHSGDIPFVLCSGIRIPCWSLAALLSVLPKNLNIGRPSLESNYKEYYWIQYYDEYMKPNNYKTECFNNPVDACYEMILKLHELNIL